MKCVSELMLMLMLTLLSTLAIIKASSVDDVQVPAVNDDVTASFATANNELGLSVYKSVTSDKDAANVFLSPVSISVALSMVYLGSRGSTRQQLTAALHFQQLQSDAELKTSVQSLLTDLNGVTGNSTLRLANRLYGEQSYKINKQFSDDLSKFYGADLAQLDFARNSETSRKIINDWVEEKTERKIKDLLVSGSVGENTALVLVSAVYFKGYWGIQFKKDLTKPAPFHLTASRTVDIQMMKVRGKKFRMIAVPELESRVLEIGYSDGGVSMYVFLPEAVDGLSKVEESLSADVIQKVLANIKKTEANAVDVSFPRFQLELTTDVKSVLKHLGVNDLFTEQADLSGIGDNLVVSDAVHKAFIKVDEEGSEAAAATAVVMTLRSSQFQTDVDKFIVDRPFTFIIIDNSSSAVLFMGRVVNPNNGGGNY